MFYRGGFGGGQFGGFPGPRQPFMGNGPPGQFAGRRVNAASSQPQYPQQRYPHRGGPSQGSHIPQPMTQSAGSFSTSQPAGGPARNTVTRTASAGYAGVQTRPIGAKPSLRTASAGYAASHVQPHMHRAPLRRTSQPFAPPTAAPTAAPVTVLPGSPHSPSRPIGSPIRTVVQAPPPRAPITLYTAGTPNGWKISIALEELGIPFETRAISFKDREQKSEWFLKINPNGRIPAIVDHANRDFAVFESGAILTYLAQKSGRLMGRTPDEHSETLQWVMFGIGGIGPMQGQANHFVRYAPEEIPYAVKRYTDETLRLYSVLDARLQGRDYLVGAGRGQFSIADITNFTWVACHEYCKVSLDTVPNVKRWVDNLSKRPSVLRGVDCPKGCMNPITAKMGEKESQEFASKAKATGLFKDGEGEKKEEGDDDKKVDKE